MNWTLRALGPEDAAAYCAARRAMLLDAPWAYIGAPGDDTPSDPIAMRDWLSKPEQAVLACVAEDGRVVATAGVYRSPRHKARHRATIWGVWCEPAFRRRGCGAVAVRAALDRAAGWPGVLLVGLSVSVRSPGAQRLYERLGFVAWGQEPGALCIDGEEIDEVYMALRLGEVRARG